MAKTENRMKVSARNEFGKEQPDCSLLYAMLSRMKGDKEVTVEETSREMWKKKAQKKQTNKQKTEGRAGKAMQKPELYLKY